MASATVSADSLKEKLTKGIPTEHVSVEDESGGCGSAFKIVVVSATFDGVGLIDRQRAVHECISEEMKEIHAIQLKTWTPAQFEKKRLAGQA